MHVKLAGSLDGLEYFFSNCVMLMSVLGWIWRVICEPSMYPILQGVLWLQSQTTNTQMIYQFQKSQCFCWIKCSNEIQSEKYKVNVIVAFLGKGELRVMSVWLFACLFAYFPSYAMRKATTRHSVTSGTLYACLYLTGLFSWHYLFLMVYETPLIPLPGPQVLFVCLFVVVVWGAAKVRAWVKKETLWAF